jgi:hypothetical protein
VLDQFLQHLDLTGYLVSEGHCDLDFAKHEHVEESHRLDIFCGNRKLCFQSGCFDLKLKVCMAELKSSYGQPCSVGMSGLALDVDVIYVDCVMGLWFVVLEEKAKRVNRLIDSHRVGLLFLYLLRDDFVQLLALVFFFKLHTFFVLFCIVASLLV